MSNSVCTHCGCTEIDKDPGRGDAVCTNCGSVLEDQIIVSDVQFQENSAGGTSVIGQYVSGDGTKSINLGGTFAPGFGRESRTVTLQNGKKKIQQLGAQLKLNNHCMDTAFNFFKMAVTKRLTKGRKSLHVIAACIYLVCRTEGTPHMLLDFSDLLQVNVYVLGRTYLHISKELCLNIPAIDPSLYIPRFAYKLEFADKTHDVSMTALRLVQRMKRDWMHTGRRPSGLCGAALLVAARIHDFCRTVKDIIKVVKVCEATVRKRLTEFQDTPSSQLTIDEFHRIDLEEERDPPCFIQGKKKAKLSQLEPNKFVDLTEEVSNIQGEIEKSLEAKRPKGGIYSSYNKPSTVEETSCSSSKSSEVQAAAEYIEKDVFSELVNSELKQDNSNNSRTNKDGEEITSLECFRVQGLTPTAASLGITEVVEGCLTDKDSPRESDSSSDDEMDLFYVNQTFNESDDDKGDIDGNLDLTGIDDEELEMLLLNEDEVKIKTEIWMKANEDYLKEQKEKEEKKALEEAENEGKPEKRKVKKVKRKPLTEATSAKEAISMLIQEKKLSNKINYDVLNDLICKPEDVKTTPLKVNMSPRTNVQSGLLNRFKRPSLSTEASLDFEGPKKKTKEEITKSEIVVETGPIQIPDKDDIGEEGDYYEEEEEEDENMSAAKLLGHTEVNDEDEGDYEYDDDD